MAVKFLVKWLVGYWDKGKLRTTLTGQKKAKILCAKYHICNCLPVFYFSKKRKGTESEE